MTEKSPVPHKLSLARAWKRLGATLLRWSDPPPVSDDYRHATEDPSSAEGILRDEAAWNSRNSLGGLGGLGDGS